MISFNDFTRSDAILLAKSSAGLQSFIEYASSFKEKVTHFTTPNDDSGNDVLTVGLHSEELNDEVVGFLTKEQYQNAFENEDAEFMVRINDAGDTITVTGEQILNAVEDITQDISLQAEVCKAAISNAEMTRQEFCTLVTTKFRDFSMDKLASYLDLIEDKDSSTTLKNLFSTYKLGTVTKKTDSQLSDEYISISNASDFTGQSVWVVAFTHLGETISGFFNVVWKGITRIGEFLYDILQGLIKFGKWLLNKMFRQFTTNWNLSNKTYGICDLPAMQVPFAKYQRDANGSITFSFPDWANRKIGAEKIPYWYNTSRDQCYRRIIQDYNGNLKIYGDSSGLLPMFQSVLKRILTEKLEESDTYEYLSEIEIILPSNPGGYYGSLAADYGIYINDWSLRLGCDEDGNVWLRIFPLLDPAYMNGATDAKIFNGLVWSWACMCDHYNHVYTLTPGLKAGGLNALPETLAPLDFMSVFCPYHLPDNFNPEDVGPFDIVGNMTFMFNAKTFLETVDPTAVSTGDSYTGDGRQYAFMYNFVFGFILPYITLNTKGLDELITWYSSQWSGVANLLAIDFTEEASSSVGPIVHFSGSYETITPPTYQQLVDYVSSFRPYAKQELLPVLAHYQSLAEQAEEIETAIVIVAVVAVVSFVAFKLHKLKVKRRNLAAIRQGNLDSLSWSLGNNPSDADLQRFRKLQKQVNRTNRINGLLGIGSPSAVVNSTFSLVGGISEQIKSLRSSASSTDNAPTISTVVSLITGQ